MSNKILVSGIQPTGILHIANYFGALKQFVDLQEQYANFVFVANYHALTTVQDKKQLEESTLDIVRDYLAVGLDPAKTTLYLQSHVPEVTELAWIFNTLVTVPYLSRAHAYKDKTAKGAEASVGLFDYPVLMAADILLLNANVVPVGQDQKQHLEYARDIALKFNNTFGETFTLPESLILETVATIPGTDGQKMSKSYNNTIPLFATRDEIQKKVMGIVTDSSGDIPKNVYALHSLFKSENDLKALYAEHAGKYKALKEALIEDMDAFIAPLRERRADIAKDDAYVHDVLRDGGRRARAKAQEKMHEIRHKVGIL